MYDGQYVIRDSAKSAAVKDKSTYVLIPKQGDQHLSDRSTIMASADGSQALEDESGTFEIGIPKFHVIMLHLHCFWCGVGWGGGVGRDVSCGILANTLGSL